jgi:hypothetical protein
MKVNILEAHDRKQHLIKNESEIIAQGAEDCLKINSLSLQLQDKSPYIYIFAHPRSSDDGRSKRLVWQPRLTKPEPQTNSYLFRAQSKTDILEIIWCIPAKELWGQYKKGNVTESELVSWSIDQYQNHRKKLAEKDKDDLQDWQVRDIYELLDKNRSK